MKLVQGQTVYVRLYSRLKGAVALKPVLVTKVGRKWATLDGGRWRVEVGSRHIDGGDYNSPGEVFLSEEEYQNVVGLAAAWTELRHSIERCYSPPSCATVESIKQAMKLLGITSEAVHP